ncbi:MAG: glutamate--tRNA ligase family protein, partial [Planctomycetota bacterium]
VVLRVEDLDGPRVKRGAAEQAIETLRWLGIDWDDGPHRQVNDLTPYRQALASLAAGGHVYPCRCTRSQLLAAELSAPNAGDHELRYPGVCRPGDAVRFQFDQPEHRDAAWRVRTPDEAVRFVDRFSGEQVFNPQEDVGDFVVATKAGTPSYQLAVVVDDARQGVTDVVRGDDLLPSTPRQMLLYRLLGLGTPPRYTHLPIVVGSDGRRLAKRHGDTRVDTYRQRGIPAERLIGLIAEWCGFGPRRPMHRDEFAAGLELSRMPRSAITFTNADDDWLRKA